MTLHRSCLLCFVDESSVPQKYLRDDEGFLRFLSQGRCLLNMYIMLIITRRGIALKFNIIHSNVKSENNS